MKGSDRAVEPMEGVDGGVDGRQRKCLGQKRRECVLALGFFAIVLVGAALVAVVWFALKSSYDAEQVKNFQDRSENIALHSATTLQHLLMACVSFFARVKEWIEINPDLDGNSTEILLAGGVESYFHVAPVEFAVITKKISAGQNSSLIIDTIRQGRNGIDLVSSGPALARDEYTVNMASIIGNKESTFGVKYLQDSETFGEDTHFKSGRATCPANLPGVHLTGLVAKNRFSNNAVVIREEIKVGNSTYVISMGLMIDKFLQTFLTQAVPHVEWSTRSLSDPNEWEFLGRSQWANDQNNHHPHDKLNQSDGAGHNMQRKRMQAMEGMPHATSEFFFDDPLIEDDKTVCFTYNYSLGACETHFFRLCDVAHKSVRFYQVLTSLVVVIGVFFLICGVLFVIFENRKLKVREVRSKRAKILNDEVSQAKAVAVREQTISYLCHELRTPLHSLKTLMTDFVEEEGIHNSSTATVLLATMEHLLALLNDSLDYWKLQRLSSEEGRGGSNAMLKAREHPVDISAVVRDVYHQFKVMHRGDTRVSLTLNVDKNLTDVFLLADKMRVRQILNNGLSNALKYSYGSVNLQLDMVSASEARDLTCAEIANKHDAWVKISITDLGPGLPAQYRPFVEFNEGEETSCHKKSQFYCNTGSSGLGLALCKTLTNALGGDLIVRNHYGKQAGIGAGARPSGTQFIVLLPYAEAKNARRGRTSSSEAKFAYQIPFFFLGPTLPQHCDNVMKECNQKLNLENVVRVQEPEQLEEILADLAARKNKLLNAGTILDTTPESLVFMQRQIADPRFTEIIKAWASKNAGPKSMFKVYIVKMTKPSPFQEEFALPCGSPLKSVFTHTVRHVHATHTAMVSESPKRTKALTEMSILGAEDDPVNNMLLNRMLQKVPKKKIFYDGLDLLQHLDETKNDFPDAIILDIVMKRSSGDEICRQLRSRGCDSLIIAATGNSRDQEMLLSSGFDSVLIKPFSRDSLLGALLQPRKTGTLFRNESMSSRSSSSTDNSLTQMRSDSSLNQSNGTSFTNIA